MSWLFFKHTDSADDRADIQVTDANPLPIEIYARPNENDEAEPVTENSPLRITGNVNAISLSQDLAHRISITGRKFYASDSVQNALVTGQTSFVNTTPTFLLENPSSSSVVCIPLFFVLNQTGTVAGGAVDVIVEIDNDRYASAGTLETIKSNRPGQSRGNQCLLYSNPTASAGYGVRVDGITTGQDVSPAEGALQQYIWTPTSVMDLLDPGFCLKVFTYAGTTGPTWFWTFAWAEVPPSWLTSFWNA